jgi:hypothetical protein
MQQRVARAGRLVLGIGVTVAGLSVVLAGRPAASAAEPCAGVQPADLAIELRASPPELAVGDVVDVEARITSTADGPAAIPLFRLLGAEPGFAVEAQESSYPALAYAHYRLRALQPGDMALRIAVNFATTVGCGDAPSLVFRSASSPLLPIRVRDVAGDAPMTVTPTGTAIPDLVPRTARGRRARR